MLTNLLLAICACQTPQVEPARILTPVFDLDPTPLVFEEIEGYSWFQRRDVLDLADPLGVVATPGRPSLRFEGWAQPESAPTATAEQPSIFVFTIATSLLDEKPRDRHRSIQPSMEILLTDWFAGATFEWGKIGGWRLLGKRGSDSEFEFSFPVEPGEGANEQAPAPAITKYSGRMHLYPGDTYCTLFLTFVRGTSQEPLEAAMKKLAKAARKRGKSDRRALRERSWFALERPEEIRVPAGTVFSRTQVEDMVGGGVDWLWQQRHPEHGLWGIDEGPIATGITALVYLAYAEARWFYGTKLDEYLQYIAELLLLHQTPADATREGEYGLWEQPAFPGQWGAIGWAGLRNHLVVTRAMLTHAARFPQHKRQEVDTALRLALRVILDTQNDDGGWNYLTDLPENFGGYSTFMTLWALWDLELGRQLGLIDDAEARAAIERGSAAVRKMIGEESRVGYGPAGRLGPDSHSPRPPASIVSHVHSDVEVLTAFWFYLENAVLRHAMPAKEGLAEIGRTRERQVRLILDNRVDQSISKYDTFYWLFSMHALSLVGGEEAAQWRMEVVQAIAHHYEAGEGDLGSWKPDSAWAKQQGRVFGTAMAVWCLGELHKLRPALR